MHSGLKLDIVGSLTSMGLWQIPNSTAPFLRGIKPSECSCNISYPPLLGVEECV